jgi:exosortase
LELIPEAGGPSNRRHLYFAGLVAASILLYWKTLSTLAVFSMHEESSSHLLLIPVISIYLLFSERKRIFTIMRTQVILGSLVILIGGMLHWFTVARASANEWSLSGEMLSLVLIWAGGFVLFYGSAALSAAAFPLAFLLLMIPIPASILDRVIYELQGGSTDIAYFLFRTTGVPVLRQGFLLSVPGVTIEVAKECSGIRSSMALFITCLLAAHLFLRAGWRKLVFVLLAFPVALIKNGVRIFTLTMLSIYVDPSFLTGNLHHKGGFVFFLLALLILAPVLMLLEKTERIQSPQATDVSLKAEAGLLPGQS